MFGEKVILKDYDALDFFLFWDLVLNIICAGWQNSLSSRSIGLLFENALAVCPTSLLFFSHGHVAECTSEAFKSLDF